jgi:hypothetical protein
MYSLHITLYVRNVGGQRAYQRHRPYCPMAPTSMPGGSCPVMHYAGVTDP